MTRLAALPANLPPRQIGRDAASAYIGVSATKFDEMVKDGRMPRPHCIDARRLWDVRQLDVAVDALPIAGGTDDAADNPFNDVVA